MNNSIDELNNITSRYGIIIFSTSDFFLAVEKLNSEEKAVALKDKKIIFNALEKYSDCGYFNATINLARCYITGFGTKPNYEKGLQLLRRLECFKDPSVYCDIGSTLLFKSSASEAKKYLTYAAEHGEVGAYFGLGLLYLGGGERRGGIQQVVGNRNV